jgi:hypothetical protein
MDAPNYSTVNSQLKIPYSPTGEYICETSLNLYDNSHCKILATQTKKGRQLKILNSIPENQGIQVYLCEDSYIAWLPIESISCLKPALKSYKYNPINRQQIEQKIPEIINFTKQAMNTPNYYLWGGTIAPNYDCSGLIQDSFATFGIWLPRDSYQQEEFTTKIKQEELQQGDLIFFGEKKVTHVALYLGEGYYIHSSGKEIGNNGIKINHLSTQDPVSANYYQILWSFGRVNKNYYI